jgi:hypothetical protein
LFCGDVLAPKVSIFSVAVNKALTVGPFDRAGRRSGRVLYIFGHRLVVGAQKTTSVDF